MSSSLGAKFKCNKLSLRSNLAHRTLAGHFMLFYDRTSLVYYHSAVIGVYTVQLLELCEHELS